MKKKIGDLTVKEVVELKKKCESREAKCSCPLTHINCGIINRVFLSSCFNLDQEIEVSDER
jgi:hypothetical protein